MKITLLTKQEAARRLLRAAIIAHFREDDPLLVHIAAQSALRVCRDVLKRSSQVPGPLESVLTDDGKKIFFKKMTELNNFLKHAEKDEGPFAINFAIIEVNEFDIQLACAYYWQSFGPIQTATWLGMFSVYMANKNPDVFTRSWIETLKTQMSLPADAFERLARDADRDRRGVRSQLQTIFPDFDF